MPSAIDQFLTALVAPGEPKYYATNYMDTPYALRSQRIILPEKVLSSSKLRRYQFLTTPTLSTCGIYVHAPTCAIIVHCEDNGSFVIRKNQYELLDIIIRTQINKDKTPSVDDTGLIDLSSDDADKSVASLSSDDEDDNSAIDVDCLLRELKILEEDNKITIPAELKFAKKIKSNPSHQFIDQFSTVLHYARPVPLLPIYIGILDNRREVITPLNYNEKYYRADTVAYKHNVVFYQKFYTSISTQNILVTPLGENNEALPKAEVAIDHALEVERILRANNDHVAADRDDIVTKIMYFYRQVYPTMLADRSSSVSSTHSLNISTPRLPQLKPSPRETPVKQTPLKETPIKETSANDEPAKETPAKEILAKEVPPKATPAKEVPAKETPLKQTSATQTPAKQTPARETPAKKIPLKETSAKKDLAKEVPAEETQMNEMPKGISAKETPLEQFYADLTPAKKNSSKEDPLKSMNSATSSRYEVSPEIVKRVRLFNDSDNIKHTPVVPNANGRAINETTLPTDITSAAQSIKLIHATDNFDSFDSSSALSSPPSSPPLPPFANEDVEIVPALQPERNSEIQTPKETREADIETGTIGKPDLISPLSSSQSDSSSPSEAHFSINDLDSKKEAATKALGVPNTALGINRKLQFQAPVRDAFSEANTPTKAPVRFGDSNSIVTRMELKNIINHDLNYEATRKKNSLLEVEQSRIFSSSSQSQSQSKFQSQSESEPQPPIKESEVIYSSNSTDADKTKTSQESDAQYVDNDDKIIVEGNGIAVATAEMSRSQADSDIDKDNSIEHSQVVIPGDIASQASEFLVRRYMEENEDGPARRKRKYAPARSRRLRNNR